MGIVGGELAVMAFGVNIFGNANAYHILIPAEGLDYIGRHKLAADVMILVFIALLHISYPDERQGMVLVFRFTLG